MCADKLEFADTQKFVISNLKNFQTTDKTNINIIEELAQKLSVPTEGSKELVAQILLQYEMEIAKENRGLKTLLFTLRKQIENEAYYTKMGVNAIDPHANNMSLNKYDNLLIKNKSSLKEFFKLTMNSENELYNDWTKDLAIVCVYGSIESHGNVYGHTLLRLGDLGYLHINNLIAKPEFIPHYLFKQYLNKNHSFVVDVQQLPHNLDTKTVQQTVKEYSEKHWQWGIVHHNCLTFTREVAKSCGVTDHELGGGHGHIKTPIDFFMALDEEKRTGHAMANKHHGFLSKHLIFNPIDDVKTVGTALHQKFWNNFWSPNKNIVRLVENQDDISLFSEDDSETTNESHQEKMLQR